MASHHDASRRYCHAGTAPAARSTSSAPGASVGYHGTAESAACSFALTGPPASRRVLLPRSEFCGPARSRPGKCAGVARLKASVAPSPRCQSSGPTGAWRRAGRST